MPENSVRNCVHFCLQPLVPLERCATFLYRDCDGDTLPYMITSQHTFGTAFVCRGHYRSASQGAPFHHGVGQIPISPFVTQETGRDTRLIAKISMILKRIEYYLARIISH